MVWACFPPPEREKKKVEKPPFERAPTKPPFLRLVRSRRDDETEETRLTTRVRERANWSRWQIRRCWQEDDDFGQK